MNNPFRSYFMQCDNAKRPEKNSPALQSKGDGFHEERSSWSQAFNYLDCGCWCPDHDHCPVPPAPIIIAPAPDETIPEAQPIFIGLAEPDALVNVCVDETCSTIRADENGEWRIPSAEALEDGAHIITASQQNECGKTSSTTSVSFYVSIPSVELSILDLQRGPVFRTVDATFEIGQISGTWTLYYLLLDPSLPAPTEEEVIDYSDPVTLTNGTAARGFFSLSQQGAILTRTLPGREVDQPLPDETGVMDGQRYILYAIAVAETGQTSGLAYSSATAIGMPFDGGNGTADQPFAVRELTIEDLMQYPDLIAEHPANRAGVNETARQLDNIEGMRVLYDQNPQNGIVDSLTLVYEILSDFDLSNYQQAYGGNGWRPIGNYDATHYAPSLTLHRFTGTLAGNDHTISNLFMAPTGETGVNWVQYVGFIGFASGATVTDLNFSVSALAPTPVLPAQSGFVLRAAVVCAYSRSSVLERLSVQSAQLTMDFGTNASTYIETGGVAGELIGGTTQSIRAQSVALVNYSSVYTYFGGLAGYVHNDSPSQPYQDIEVEDISCGVFTGTSMYAGGLMGYCSAVNPVVLQNITAIGTQLQAGRAHSGGLIGYLRGTTSTTLRSLAVANPVIQSQIGGYYAGGVVGYLQTPQRLILQQITVAKANVRAQYAAGGMVGWMDVQSGANVEISGFSVEDSTIQVETSYAGGAIGEIYRALNTSLYIHEGQIPANTSIRATSNSGGLIGDLFHEDANTLCYVENCASAASVTCSGSNAGGLFGYCNMTALSNCTSSGQVAGGIDRSGGFLGSANAVSIANCAATGNVSGTSYVGGFIGNIFGGNVLPSADGPFEATPNLITLCAVRASSVTATSEYIGGFAGRSSGMTYDQCFTLATVTTTTANYAGGFIGSCINPGTNQQNGSMQNCYATGTVTGTGTTYGGIVGNNQFPVANCYSAGAQVAGNNTVGGVVGASSLATGSITASLALGDLVSSQGAQAGRIAASNTGVAPLRNNYALNTLLLVRNGTVVTPSSNPSGNDGGTVTLADLPAIIQTIGWDTETIWDLSAIETLGRPTLLQNPE